MKIEKEYILMCEKAQEIQNIRLKNFAFEVGDIIYSKNKNSVFYLGNAVIKKRMQICGYDLNESDWIGTDEENIWLPRQYQLQELIVDEYLGDIKHNALLDDFEKWRKKIIDNETEDSDDNYSYFSIEKLWLVYVMEMKFNKIWTGTVWD